jgi:hypothetical protein
MTAAALGALVALGAFHGLNPGMGWLFAVAIGLQERRRAAVLRALGPIAAGHAASVLVVALAVGAFSSVVAGRFVAIGGGVVLVGFGMWRVLSRRHFRWAGMRLTAPQLASWSFLMSSVHGAGLMLLPVLVATTAGAAGAGGGGHHAAAGAVTWWAGIVATGVHTLATAAVTGVVAIVVYEVVGLRILRTGWINLDRIWAFALVGAGVATVALNV